MNSSIHTVVDYADTAIYRYRKAKIWCEGVGSNKGDKCKRGKFRTCRGYTEKEGERMDKKRTKHSPDTRHVVPFCSAPYSRIYASTVAQISKFRAYTSSGDRSEQENKNSQSVGNSVCDVPFSPNLRKLR